MLTLQQQASLFTVFGVAVVSGMGILTYRQAPNPVYRSWMHSYAWGLFTAIGSTLVAFLGFNWFALTILTMGATGASWWMLRMRAQLLEHPFQVRAHTWVLAGFFVGGQALWLAGVPLKLAIGPAALAVVFAHLRLGWVMFRVGHAGTWRGLDWLGITVIIHGIWITTYPAVVDSPLHSVGHMVDACINIGVGAAMVTFIMLQTMARLEELDRLKHEFLSAASHELRTPLTSVMGYAEFLQDGIGGPLTPEQLGYVAQIQKGSQRLRRIVDEMLDLARVQAGTFELVPQAAELGEIVREEVLSLLPQAHERQVTLTVEVPPDAMPALVDARRVGQVVLNLVSNALKFTPPGGRVHVLVQRDARGYRVEVRDSGIGIDPAHLHRLFERFFQVDIGIRRAHGGAGLGLTIAKSLVEAHGGTIGVESDPGQGSTFWFHLPG
ncbi:MAG: Sensory box histidine kinase [Cyanobacteria bacterium RYN_339]|nr:Sensory box histidine kinase [Cyanobacteria bacterium RYN_339]